MLALYAAGSKEGGLGHLSRLIALSKFLTTEHIIYSLFFEVDWYACAWLNSKGINYLPADRLGDFQFDVLVVDAITASDSVIKQFFRARTRIFLSPICEFFHMATHVFVREINPKYKAFLSSAAVLVVDERFAFFGRQTGKAKVSNFKDGGVKIGIVLSGGDDQSISPSGLISALSEIEKVCEVTLVGNNNEAIAFDSPSVRQHRIQKTSDDLWKVLSGINIFIGRQGLMVFEALSRGIPVISLFLPGETVKNNVFICKGLVAAFEYSEAGVEDLKAYIRNAEQLNSSTKKVSQYSSHLEMDLLFRQVISVL